MAKVSRTRVTERVISREELEGVVREVLKAVPGLKRTGVKKALPRAYQRSDKDALTLLQEWAARGEIYRWSKGSTEHFYLTDPLETLDRVAPVALGESALTETELKAVLETAAPGHAPLLKEWLKSARQRALIHEHAPAAGSRSKRFGRNPDLRLLLKSALTALRKSLAEVNKRGIPRERVAIVLLEELGVSPETLTAHSAATSSNAEASAPLVSATPDSQISSSNGEARSAFLKALSRLSADNPSDALLSVRELRERVQADKTQFDTLALKLWKEGAVRLHHHDHPSSLPEVERRQLIEDDRGVHYVGIALRRE